MSDRLLTPKEVWDITGYKQPKRQIKWLAANDWKFDVGGDSCPKILRAYADSRQSKPPAKRSGPRLEGLARGQNANKISQLVAETGLSTRP